MVTTDQYNKLREQELILKAAKSGGRDRIRNITWFFICNF